eukprot:TRINITY_DN9363_c0_g1_i1.p1 TRINITY_DN9363_c0_g1~~TRINITY_DN9363_c0_g1_i1.p1  ORF type:complete len:100 (-),score=16.87 TRINITY_DN9363_c0_g1_i1:153-452(-)
MKISDSAASKGIIVKTTLKNLAALAQVHPTAEYQSVQTAIQEKFHGKVPLQLQGLRVKIASGKVVSRFAAIPPPPPPKVEKSSSSSSHMTRMKSAQLTD